MVLEEGLRISVGGEEVSPVGRGVGSIIYPVKGILGVIKVSDSKFFSEYCKSFRQLFGSSGDFAYIKDIGFKYREVSSDWMSLMGFTDRKQVLGRMSSEVPFLHHNDALGKVFSDQDQAVKTTLSRKIFLDVMNFQDEIHTLIVYKIPIINPDTNNFVGIRGHLGHLINPNIIKTLLRLHAIKGLLVNHHNDKKDFQQYQLNEMQHMVLYLCLNNYSYSEIAMLLSAFGYEITPTRVNDYIDQLKIIFRVSTKTQLTEKAIGLDLHTFLPAGLMKLGSIDISQQDIQVVS